MANDTLPFDLSSEFLGVNATGDYWYALGVFVTSFLVLLLVDFLAKKSLDRAARKFPKTTDFATIGSNFFHALTWPLYAYIGLFIALYQLQLTQQFKNILNFLLVLVLTFFIARGVILATETLIGKRIRKKNEQDSERGKSMLNVLQILIKIIVWSVAFLMILAYLGIDITPMIAGLGVGGIAIALALQNILGDLFAAFAIYFDKPFEEGDFIIIGSDMGVVKTIGIKTTRIQTLQGQELIVSNTEMVSTRVNNYKRMPERRVAFNIGVEYSTPSAKLKKINDLVAKTVKPIKGVRLDRSHFQKFGDFSLIYEIVYYIDTNDYNRYMDVQQEINFGLKDAFEKEGIVFAFPTQTLFLKKE